MTVTLPETGLHAYGVSIELTAQQRIPSKGYHGSWLRGLLGHALFQSCCIHPEPVCLSCALAHHCPYPQIFKPHLHAQSDRLPGYLIHHWQVRDQSVRVELIFIGWAVRYAEPWMLGLIRAENRLNLGGGGSYRVQRIQNLADRTPLYQNRRFQPHTLTPLPLRVAAPDQPLTIHLTTPLVTKHTDEADPITAPLRTRLRHLMRDYAAEPLAAEAWTTPLWQVTAHQLRRQVIPRGEERVRAIDGKIGTLTLTGITPLGHQLLALAEQVHIGAETSLGCGRLLRLEKTLTH